MTNRPTGQIITFYSYKGGTGRTMALANIACLLARQTSEASQSPPRVLAIDWDFEAPGLHRYLQPYLEPDAASRFKEAPGCLELFQFLASERSAYNPDDFVGNRKRAHQALETMDLDRYLLPTNFQGLSLMKAGSLKEDYPRQVSGFDWDELFHSTVGLFAGVADFLRTRFDYVLLDSRTGITDTSGICTMLLPDKLVVVFTPNQQSLNGIENLVRKAVAYRKGSPDGRSLTVFPLPSRVEMARPQLLEAWRKGTASSPTTNSPLPAEMQGYQIVFEQLFAQIYARPEISLDDYFTEVMLQHVPDYAYGEPVAVVLETSDSRISLSRSYAAFRDRLIELDVPWASLQATRLGRDIIHRCERIEEKLRSGAMDDAAQLGFGLIELKPPAHLFERSTNTILDVARAIYPRNREAAATLIRQGSGLAIGESDIDPAVLGESLLEAGKLCLQFGDFTPAIMLLEASMKRLSACFGGEHPATLNAMESLARALGDGGRLADARALQDSVLSSRRRLFGDANPETLTAMNNLAGTLQSQGDLAGARQLQETVLEALRRLLGTEHPDTLTAMNNLAGTLWNQGDLAGARQLEETVLKAHRRLLGAEHPATLSSMNNLAGTLQSQGDLAGARQLQETVLAVSHRLLGAEHPDTLTAMNNLAGTLQSQDDLTGARQLQETVLEARRRVLGAEHPATLNSMNNLAGTLKSQGDLAGAHQLQETVFEARRRVLGAEHPDTLISMGNLASTLQSQGDLAGARQLREAVLEASRRVFGAEHPDTLTSMNNLASTLAASGDLKDARTMGEQVLELRTRVLGASHPATISSMRVLGDILKQMGEAEKALELLSRALDMQAKGSIRPEGSSRAES